MTAHNLLDPPLLEGSVGLPDGRQLGFAEYGSPHGRAVFWFHGTPGARRQIPPIARALAAERDVRLIALERPGVGDSTPHLYEAVIDYAADVEVVADRFGIGRFGAIGLSGGGPYVLSCAAALPDRFTAGAILGGIAPSQGDDAVEGGAIGFATRLAPVVEQLRTPLGHGLSAVAQVLARISSQVFDLYMHVSPEGDKAVFRRPEMKEMFIDDLSGAIARGGMRSLFSDIVLFSRPWGFRLGDVSAPIRFWHGDADHLVPLAHGEHVAALVPDSDFSVRPGESHLGSLDAAEEILDAILSLWPDEDAERPVVAPLTSAEDSPA
ncbi:MAG: alpha/beta hydrolase [Acidimicrobiia bacterium]